MNTNPNDVAPTEELTKQAPDTVPMTETTLSSPAPLSANKLAANRRNARKSTGPRTLTGKLSSRMNAVRHGILSSAVVVRGLRIQEQEDEFRALRDQCWECLAPVGRIEEMLVDKIVTAWWRSRRALIAETGEIVKSVDGGRWRRSTKDPISLVTFLDESHDASMAMTKSTQGLDYLKYILEKVREGMESDGELTEKMCEWVRRRFMNQPNAMTRALEEYRAKFLANASAVAPGASSSATATGDEMADREGLSASAVAPAAMADREELKEMHQTAVERYIESMLMNYAELSGERQDREEKEETAQQAADVLPSAEVLEKIMRYEGSLDRQLYRAMNQLERLQRRRGGESLSAPLMMDVMR